MRPLFYLDLFFPFKLNADSKKVLHTNNKQGTQEFHNLLQMSRENRDTLPYRAARTMRILHSLFRETPRRYALALPGEKSYFSVLRVFAETQGELDSLADALEGKLELGLNLGRIRRVPDNFNGEWRSYRRYRIPTRKAERKPDGTLRQRRILVADEQNMPYFQLHSRSTGSHFGLRVNILTVQAPCEGVEAEPDSYGLAVSTRPFALPHIPTTYENA